MESLLAINTCYLVIFTGYGRLILKKYDVFNSIQFILIVLFFLNPCKENPKCIRNTIRNTRNASYFGKIRNASEIHHKYQFSPSLHPSLGLILKHILSFTPPPQLLPIYFPHFNCLKQKQYFHKTTNLLQKNSCLLILKIQKLTPIRPFWCLREDI